MAGQGHCIHLRWRWEPGRRPSARALRGLEVLLRFLGLKARERVPFGATDAVEFAVRESWRPDAPSRAESLSRLRSWGTFVLQDYPGTWWEMADGPGAWERLPEPLESERTAA